MPGGFIFPRNDLGGGDIHENELKIQREILENGVEFIRVENPRAGVRENAEERLIILNETAEVFSEAEGDFALSRLYTSLENSTGSKLSPEACEAIRALGEQQHKHIRGICVVESISTDALGDDVVYIPAGVIENGSTAERRGLAESILKQIRMIQDKE